MVSAIFYARSASHCQNKDRPADECAAQLAPERRLLGRLLSPKRTDTRSRRHGPASRGDLGQDRIDACVPMSVHIGFDQQAAVFVSC